MAKITTSNVIKYIYPVFAKFLITATSCKGRLTLLSLKTITKQSCGKSIKIDSAGEFIRENANNKQELFMSLVIYVAYVHAMIDGKNWQEFADVINTQYNIKRTLKSRYGDEFDEIFTYIGNLLFFGKKMFGKKVITKENILKWNLVGVD